MIWAEIPRRKILDFSTFPDLVWSDKTVCTELAIWCLRPLGHLSALPIFRAIPRTSAPSSCLAGEAESITFPQLCRLFAPTADVSARDLSAGCQAADAQYLTVTQTKLKAAARA
jgi:hypothetical protein